ncbi:Hypothetical_protein [Hexamita inflata]|uniref:Hypothetical_protein n=1 Tax=Hexamita inflata TaxID=28002 RepID=A0ABP1H7G3_9EUKA
MSSAKTVSWYPFAPIAVITSVSAPANARLLVLFPARQPEVILSAYLQLRVSKQVRQYSTKSELTQFNCKEQINAFQLQPSIAIFLLHNKGFLLSQTIEYNIVWDNSEYYFIVKVEYFTLIYIKNQISALQFYTTPWKKNSKKQSLICIKIHDLITLFLLSKVNDNYCLIVHYCQKQAIVNSWMAIVLIWLSTRSYNRPELAFSLEL